MELEYIFIYGIFRDASHNILDDAIFCDPAFIYGRLYQVNEFYPGFVREDCNNRVYGEVYLIDPAIFEKLDEFEGDEYVRKKIWTSIDEECWIYEYKYPVDGIKEIIGGDWLLR